jgi:replication factor C subunit 1
VTTAPTSKTSYVVVGQTPGEKKLEKIKEMKIKTLDEERFYDFINKFNVAKKETKKTDVSGSQTQTAAKPVVKSANPFAVKEPPQYVRPAVKSMPNSGILWTDKYKPTSYKDIIGNKTNVDKLVLFLNKWYTLLYRRESNRSQGFVKSKDELSQYRACLLSG